MQRSLLSAVRRCGASGRCAAFGYGAFRAEVRTATARRLFSAAESGGGSSFDEEGSGGPRTAPAEDPIVIAPKVTADVVVNQELKPKEIVSLLDKHIIGQDEAKRAVAIALRNRWRRKQVEEPLRSEIIPKNILMIGPTGVGKTEVARRLANLLNAPFLKVEATKFTEVGFHGRDVDSIIRDLVGVAISNVRKQHKERMKEKVQDIIESKILDALIGEGGDGQSRETFRDLLRKGLLEEREISMEFRERNQMQGQGGNELPPQLASLVNQMGNMFAAPRSQLRRVTVAEARPILQEQVLDQEVNTNLVTEEALEAVQSSGIVFIDEIDKICERRDGIHSNADASSEGVQRDLLPIIEGSTVNTKHGNVDTSKILFIASGAFHSCKPSDLLAELQGRLPIRVELKPLKEEDLYHILTRTESNLIRQQQALLETEGMDVVFTDEAVREMARVASEVNEQVQNIGARRLHTVLERIVEDISFDCPTDRVEVTAETVKEKIGDMLLKTDLSKYVL